MEPHLKPIDKLMFYKYLDNASVYFEYGCGGSTYQASIRDNIKTMYSVESDPIWYNKLKKMIPGNKFVFIYNEMKTRPRSLGRPGPGSTHDQWKNYSNQITLLSDDAKYAIDLVFIDGRFRVACCLKVFNSINDECLVAFDDFLNRPYYHIVLDYYDIIDKTADKCMVILKKKNGVVIPEDLIKKYELIAR